MAMAEGTKQSQFTVKCDLGLYAILGGYVDFHIKIKKMSVFTPCTNLCEKKDIRLKVNLNFNLHFFDQ